MTKTKGFTIIGLVVLGVSALMYFIVDRARYHAFEMRRQIWHEQCDVYRNKPVDSPAARACAKDLAALVAYAKQQGWQ